MIRFGYNSAYKFDSKVKVDQTFEITVGLKHGSARQSGSTRLHTLEEALAIAEDCKCRFRDSRFDITRISGSRAVVSNDRVSEEVACITVRLQKTSNKSRIGALIEWICGDRKLIDFIWEASTVTAGIMARHFGQERFEVSVAGVSRTFVDDGEPPFVMIVTYPGANGDSQRGQ